MTRTLKHAVTTACLVLALFPTAAMAQAGYQPVYQPTPLQARSPTLGYVGIVTMITGSAWGLMTVSWPTGEAYYLNSREYCYKETRNSLDFYPGDCTEIRMFDANTRPYAFLTLGAGVAMTILGFQKVPVQVAPLLTRDRKGLQGTIRWGGR